MAIAVSAIADRTAVVEPAVAGTVLYGRMVVAPRSLAQDNAPVRRPATATVLTNAPPSPYRHAGSTARY